MRILGLRMDKPSPEPPITYYLPRTMIGYHPSSRRFSHSFTTRDSTPPSTRIRCRCPKCHRLSTRLPIRRRTPICRSTNTACTMSTAGSVQALACSWLTTKATTMNHNRQSPLAGLVGQWRLRRPRCIIFPQVCVTSPGLHFFLDGERRAVIPAGGPAAVHIVLRYSELEGPGWLPRWTVRPSGSRDLTDGNQYGGAAGEGSR